MDHDFDFSRLRNIDEEAGIKFLQAEFMTAVVHRIQNKFGLDGDAVCVFNTAAMEVLACVKDGYVAPTHDAVAGAIFKRAEWRAQDVWRLRKSQTNLGDAVHDVEAPAGDDPALLAEASELNAFVIGFLSALPADTAAVMNLLVLNGWCTKAVAQHTGKSEGTVRQIKSRTLRLLLVALRSKRFVE